MSFSIIQRTIKRYKTPIIGVLTFTLGYYLGSQGNTPYYIKPVEIRSNHSPFAPPPADEIQNHIWHHELFHHPDLNLSPFNGPTDTGDNAPIHSNN